MARALAFAQDHASSITTSNIARFVLVTGCALALALAGVALPL